MAFGSLLCAADPALGLASWCHCAAALGNPELSVPRECRDFLSAIASLVGPGFGPPKCEIVGVGGRPTLRLLRLDDLIGNALALTIGHSLFLGVEANAELLLHVAG